MINATEPFRQDMKKIKLIILLIIYTIIHDTAIVFCQTDTLQNKLEFDGQISAFTLFNPENTFDFYFGGRLLPELNWQKEFTYQQIIDAEFSANVFGSVGFTPFNNNSASASVRPYRFWLRYSKPQFELRAGLQKINFGSATILRPLMWFDQVDPRDPLQLTDGVWGILARYYFINNTNIWFWSLMGNKNRRGFDLFASETSVPEIGSRIQFPIKKGEIGFTYHFRSTDISNLSSSDTSPEHRMALDGKWDVTIGAWVEASWVHQRARLGNLNNQNLITLGADYTIGIGNGLNVLVEHLVFTIDQHAFEFSNVTNFTAYSLGYPIHFYDNLRAIIYYDWSNEKIYNTLQWQHEFRSWTLNLLAFWNPKDAQLPQQNFNENLFGGQGIQILAVYNY